MYTTSPLARLKANFRGINQTNITRTARRACLNVSIDQKNEKGTKLKAIIEKANKTFGSFDIMLCDSLNRFNLIIENQINMQEAEKMAITMGENWINNNAAYLDHLTIPGRIIRWNEWRSHKNLPVLLQQVTTLVETKPSCLHVFKSVALDYYKRKGLAPTKEAMTLSLQYLIEECAVIVLWAQAGYNFELYPSTRNPVVSYAFNHFFNEILQNRLYFLRIEFKKSFPERLHEQKKPSLQTIQTQLEEVV